MVTGGGSAVFLTLDGACAWRLLIVGSRMVTVARWRDGAIAEEYI
jgi:hypothetical protein